MKKLNKILLILFFILIIIFFINLIRNYMILKNIFSSNNTLKENLNNYYLEANDTSNVTKTCIYSKDNVYAVDIYENNELIKSIWIDANNYEYVEKDINKNEVINKDYDDFYTKYYQFLCLDFHDFSIHSLISKSYLLKSISEKNNEYKINIYDNATVFVDKESKLIKRMITDTNEIYYKLDNYNKIDKELLKPEI